MVNKRCVLVVILSLISGLTGGIVSSQLFQGETVFAQEKLKREKVVWTDILVASKIIVEDGKRKARILIETLPHTEDPTLFLKDVNGKTRVGLGLRSGNPVLSFTDDNERVTLELKSFLGMGSSLKLIDNKDKTAAVLSTWSTGPYLGPRLHLDGRKRKGGALLEGRDDGLTLFDKGNPIWKAP